MLRRALPAVPCALATHGLLYRTLWPADGAHRYFGWFEPAVAVLCVVALGALLGLLLVASFARRFGWPFRSASLSPPESLTEVARSLAATSVFVLLVQESVERSLRAGRPTFAAFSPSQWLVLLAGAAFTSLALALALRAGGSAVRRVLRSSAAPARAATGSPGWSVVTEQRRRPRPLAGLFALRAPPLLVG